MIKLILRILFILGFAILMCVGEYQIFGKKSEYTAPHHGTVISSYNSTGRYSSTCFATVHFDNGDIQDINTGHHCYAINDSFTGSLEWVPFVGICGTAYTWHPTQWVSFVSVITASINCLCIMLLIGYLFFIAFFNSEDDT